MTFERKKLFDGIRLLLKRRGLTLTQKRVDAIEFLIKEFEKTDWRIEWIAYAMATIAHETAWTFKPIKEYRARSGRAKELQDRYWGSG
ncbi:hypothetical protein OFP26_27755, partial [Escherichia coli]|nr:hypothetical protein [Escherichia coli]